MPRTAELTYNYYERISIKYDNRGNIIPVDEVLDKQIISLARRNKFYLGDIQGLIKKNIWRKGSRKEIIVAKKGVKVVGIIIFWGELLWGDCKMCMDLHYWLVDKDYRNMGIGGELYSMMEKQATRFGLVNYSVMYKKDDDMLKQLYEKKGYKFIPRYDGVDTQDCCGDIHIKVFKVIISEYRIPTAITGGDEVPNLLLLR